MLPSHAKPRPVESSQAAAPKLGPSQASSERAEQSRGIPSRVGAQPELSGAGTRGDLNHSHPGRAQPGRAEPAWDSASQFFFLRNRPKVHMRTAGT